MVNTFDTPPPTENIIIRRREDKSLWVILGLVAVVAIVALVYVFSQNTSARQQAAVDQAVATQQSIDSAGQASSIADQAARSATLAAGAAGDAAATASRNAAANATANADRAAANADRSAANAATPAPASPDASTSQ